MFVNKKESAAVVLTGETATTSGLPPVHVCIRYSLDNEHGFTLVELLVSVLLMTIGLFAVVQMQIVALNKTVISYRLTTASALAESALEDVMSWSNSDPRLSSTTAITSFSLGNSPFTISNVQYTVTCTLAQSTPISGMTQVLVNVTGGGRNISITGYREVI